VLLDVNLPGIDGFETCRRIMASDSSHKPAVIFLSGDGDPGMIAKGLHLGAADFLQKPVASALYLRRCNDQHTARCFGEAGIPVLGSHFSMIFRCGAVRRLPRRHVPDVLRDALRSTALVVAVAALLYVRMHHDASDSHTEPIHQSSTRRKNSVAYCAPIKITYTTNSANLLCKMGSSTRSPSRSATACSTAKRLQRSESESINEAQTHSRIDCRRLRVHAVDATPRARADRYHRGDRYRSERHAGSQENSCEQTRRRDSRHRNARHVRTGSH
ncbi:MAG: response regulator, partial [Planctomycetes bacterium]|nr:response regulator [Planctomycetota bacterium]